MIVAGRQIAEEILTEVAQTARGLKTPLRLAAVLVGNHPGSKKFLELKKKVAEKIGIEFKIYEFPGTITTRELRQKAAEIAKARINHGVIVELPLPDHINTQYILNAIPKNKDVDALSQKVQGAFFAGRSLVLPPAVEAVKIILEKHNLDPKAKNCAVFGYGLLVGKPLSHWLAAQGTTVFIINEFTPDPGQISRQADIIVLGAGKAGLLKSDMIKEEVAVIDFGYENKTGMIRGDADFAGVAAKASLITPVPGGVGPIVIAAVFKNLVILNS